MDEQGKIIKGIGGFYYVKTAERIYECKARGLFRKDGIKPLVGDDCEVSPIRDVLTENGYESANITRILPRRNALIRPAVANVDAALVIFENDDHYAYIHQAQRFNMVLDAFLRSDY